MITFFVPGSPPSANLRQHYQVTARERAKFRKATAEIAELYLYPYGPITNYAIVTVRRVAKDHRRRDPGSLAEMVKPILDGIVDSGLLIDDNENCINLRLLRTRVEKGATTGIEVEIRPVPGTLAPCP